MNQQVAITFFAVVVSLSPSLSPAQEAVSNPNDEVQSRSIKVFGCEISLDVNAVKRCLDNKIEDQVKDATRPLRGQIDDLRGAIDNLGRTPVLGCRITPDIRQTTDCLNDKVDRQVNLEVAKAQAQLNVQLKALDRQKDSLEQQLANLQKNNPLAPLAGKFQKDLQALAALGQMNLDGVNTCLAAASSAQRDMVQLTQRFVANPAAFPPYLIMEVWQQMEGNFDIVMQEELVGLRESAANGKLPQADIVLDRSVRALKKLAERDPSAKCVYTAMEPHIPAMKQAARGVQQQIADKAMNLLQTKVLPAILDPVGQQMGQVFNQIMQSDMTGNSLGSLLPNQKELDRIIRGVAAEQLIRPSHVRKVAQKVRAMSASLGNPQQVQTSLQDLQKVLDKQEIWPEEVAIQVAMEILRFSGHKWVDSDMPGAGAFVANLAVSTIGTTKDTVGNVVESACGLIPEAGAAVCSIFKQLIEVGYNYVTPEAMKIVISNTMHGALDQGINEIAKAYIQKYDPRQARQNMGAFASILNAFPTRELVISFATKDRSIKEMQLALFDYNDSVRQFAEVAARR
ncbi:MAG: hypothetical protein Q8L77_07510 [Nitrospirota bacterium]|nr:hypothetical protein [Nitrospirota bacterium]